MRKLTLNAHRSVLGNKEGQKVSERMSESEMSERQGVFYWTVMESVRLRMKSKRYSVRDSLTW